MFSTQNLASDPYHFGVPGGGSHEVVSARLSELEKEQKRRQEQKAGPDSGGS